MSKIPHVCIRANGNDMYEGRVDINANKFWHYQRLPNLST